MKELKKLNVGNIDEPQLTSTNNEEDDKPQEPKFGSSSACFYNCLAYCALKFDWKCDPSTFAQDYKDGSLYKSIYGKTETDETKLKWRGTGCLDEKLNGPYIDNQENHNLSHVPCDYTNNYFDMQNSRWSVRDGVKKLMEPSIGGYVMGVIAPSSNNSSWGCEQSESKYKHAVILQSVSTTGEYSYYDPTTGKNGKCTQSQVLLGMKLTGVKEAVKNK